MSKINEEKKINNKRRYSVITIVSRNNLLFYAELPKLQRGRNEIEAQQQNKKEIKQELNKMK